MAVFTGLGRGDEVQSTGQQSFPTRQRMIERRELPVTYIGRKPFLSITAFRECLKKRELKAVTERRRAHRRESKSKQQRKAVSVGAVASSLRLFRSTSEVNSKSGSNAAQDAASRVSAPRSQ